MIYIARVVIRVDSIINLSKSSEDAPPLPAAKSTESAAATEAAPAADNPDAIPEVWLVVGSLL